MLNLAIYQKNMYILILIHKAVQVVDNIDTIKKSILAKAFRGKLGTNIPEDESAMELLKIILNKGEC